MQRLNKLGVTLVLLSVFVFYIASADENCPGVDMTALRAQREIVITNYWTTRTAGGQEHLHEIYANFSTSDDGNPAYIHEFIIDGFGAFPTRVEAEEYAMLAVDPNVFLLATTCDRVSLQWIESNVVTFRTITNYTFGFLPGKPTYDGFVNRNLVRFEPCTAKVWIDYVKQDPLVARAIVREEQKLPASQICGIIQSACTGQYQVYETQAECEAYIGAMGDSPCPAGQLTNTSNCYFFHGTAAIYLPEIHCAHVRPWYSPDGPSAKCVDFCLEEGCANCHPDAHCEFTTPFGEFVSTYACVCNDGYTGDGVNFCYEKSCTADYQCPSQTPYVDCVNNLCSCVTSFAWNASTTAANNGEACGCAEGLNLLWTDGVPECVPIGRCRDGHREDCTAPNGPHNWNSVQCREYGSNVLLDHLYKSCLCNYGYDNPGFSSACRCSAPKREVWDPTTQGNVCLTPTECTQNYHCSSNQCNVPSGATVGTCAE